MRDMVGPSKVDPLATYLPNFSKALVIADWKNCKQAPPGPLAWVHEQHTRPSSAISQTATHCNTKI